MYAHPQICDYGEKEKHFFDKEEYVTDYEAHLENYEMEFSQCRKKEFTIDSTPSYVQYPIVPVRINESYSRAELFKKRFIVVIREPVSRFYSQYQMRLRVCFKGLSSRNFADDDENEHRLRVRRNCKGVVHNFTMRSVDLPAKKLRFRTFKEWVHDSEDGVTEITRGYYKEKLAAWLRFVPRANLFVIPFDDLVSTTNRTMFQVAGFLGIDPKLWYHGKRMSEATGIILPVPTYKKPDYEEGFLDCATFDYLKKHYEEKNSGLVEFINMRGGPRSIFEPAFSGWNYTKSKCV
jgi:hypothetical protein